MDSESLQQGMWKFWIKTLEINESQTMNKEWINSGTEVFTGNISLKDAFIVAVIIFGDRGILDVYY